MGFLATVGKGIKKAGAAAKKYADEADQRRDKRIAKLGSQIKEEKLMTELALQRQKRNEVQKQSFGFNPPAKKKKKDDFFDMSF